MDVVQALRRAHEVRLVDAHEVGIGSEPAQRAHHPVPHAKARGAGAECLDGACEFDAQHGGQLKRESLSDEAFANLPVDAVHTGGPNADQDLAWSGCGLGDFSDFCSGSPAIGPDQHSALRGGGGGHFNFLIRSCDGEKIGRCIDKTKTRK
jgi:hypothetical protein